MRLAFPSGEHEEVPIGKGTTTIGSSPDDDISLPSDGIQPGHALIIIDQRGITLAGATDTSDPASMRVNGRDVVEKAILRLGDHIEVGPISMVLRGEGAPSEAPGDGPAEQADRDQPARYLLRGVRGQFQGRVLSLFDELKLGSDPDSDLVVAGEKVCAHHLTIELKGDEVYLRRGDDAGMTVVNGNPAENIRLNPGDQVAVGDERFVLESPAFVPGKAYSGESKAAGTSNTQVFTAPVIEKKEAPNEVDAVAARRRRDNMVVLVCLAISAAMLLWLMWIYLSS